MKEKKNVICPKKNKVIKVVCVCALFTNDVIQILAIKRPMHLILVKLRNRKPIDSAYLAN